MTTFPKDRDEGGSPRWKEVNRASIAYYYPEPVHSSVTEEVEHSPSDRTPRVLSLRQFLMCDQGTPRLRHLLSDINVPNKRANLGADIDRVQNELHVILSARSTLSPSLQLRVPLLTLQ
jgi:hypothetical protein